MFHSIGRYVLKGCMYIGLASGYSYLWYPDAVSRSREEYEITVAFESEVISRADGRVLAASGEEWRAAVAPVQD